MAKWQNYFLLSGCTIIERMEILVLPRVLKSLTQNIPESCNTKEKKAVGVSGILVGNCTSLFTSLFLDSYLLTAEETAAYIGLWLREFNTG